MVPRTWPSTACCAAIGTPVADAGRRFRPRIAPTRGRRSCVALRPDRKKPHLPAPLAALARRRHGCGRQPRLYRKRPRALRQSRKHGIGRLAPRGSGRHGLLQPVCLGTAQRRAGLLARRRRAGLGPYDPRLPRADCPWFRRAGSAPGGNPLRCREFEKPRHPRAVGLSPRGAVARGRMALHHFVDHVVYGLLAGEGLR